MKLKYSFETIDMPDEIVAVPTGENAESLRGVVKLNKEGLEIFELLKEETTEEKIVDILDAKYQNDRETLAGYVHATVEALRKNGLIED